MLQLATSVSLPTLVAGVQRPDHLFNASTIDNSKSTKCGAMELMGSDMRSIHTRELRSWLELLESLSLTTSVKMGSPDKILVNFTSMGVSNLLEYLRFEVADFLLFPIPGLQIDPSGRTVLVPLVPMEILVSLLSLKYGVEVLLITL